jgi:hypothetical protein
VVLSNLAGELDKIRLEDVSNDYAESPLLLLHQSSREFAINLNRKHVGDVSGKGAREGALARANFDEAV